MTAGVGARQPREVLDVGAHLGGAERAVDPDDERLRVLDRGPEGLDRLPGQRSPAQVHDRDREPQRQVRRDLAGGRDRGLRVERVEDRLDQQQVDAALGQGRDLLRVRGLHLIEGDRAEGRVVHPRRERQRHIERTHRARDETTAGFVRGLPGEPRARQVHVPDSRLEAVVALADAGRREGVGGGDIRAGGEILPVDVQDDVGPGQVQDVRIARQVARVVTEPLRPVVVRRQARGLEGSAPGSVQDQDPLVERLSEIPHVRCHCAPPFPTTQREARAVARDSLGVFVLVAKLSSNHSRCSKITARRVTPARVRPPWPKPTR